ncbi:MAG: uroporphyrinogen-III synthase [Acidobacteriota bacterium]
MRLTDPAAALAGRTVVITRPREQAASLARALHDLGAAVMEFPVIAIEPVDDPARIDAAVARLATTDWVIFTSVNGVTLFLDRVENLDGDLASLQGCRVAAIGPVTAGALEERGVTPCRIPAHYQAEGLLASLGDVDWSGKRVLVPRAWRAREVLPETLRAAGATVDVLPVYRTVRPDLDVSSLREAIEAGGIDAVTFTSSSTVSAFVSCVGAEEAPHLLVAGQVAVACIGPITAATAREAGLSVAVEARSFTAEGLADALVEYFSAEAGR